MIKCELCKKEVSSLHKKSHIIPNWMYEYVYDKKNRSFSAKGAIDDLSASKIQTGYYSEIVCKECEGDFAKDDSYCAIFFKGNKAKDLSDVEQIYDANYNFSLGLLTYKNDEINHKLLKRFVLGVLIRSHLYYKKENFVEDFLHKHFESIIEAYHNDDYEDFPILIYKGEESFKKYCILPFNFKTTKGINKGHYQYCFLAFGFYFVTFISSHSKSKQVDLLKLNKGKDFIITCCNLGSFPEVKQILDNIVSLKKESNLKF